MSDNHFELMLDPFLEALFATLDEIDESAILEPRRPTAEQARVLSADEFEAFLNSELPEPLPLLAPASHSAPTTNPAVPPTEIVKGTEPPPKPKIWGEYWVPETYNDIQVNFCKNPSCTNFGVSAGGVETRPKKGRKAKSASPATVSANPEPFAPHTTEAPQYKIIGVGKNSPALLCPACGKSTTIKSNKGVYEEFIRASGELLKTEPELYCPDEYCANHEVPVSAGAKYYYIKGRTNAGTPRFLCRACEKTFTGKPKTTNKQRRIEENEKVFAHVVSKVVIKKTRRLLDIKPQLYYSKLELVARRCSEFLAYQEKRMLTGEFQLPPLNISVDRQNYTLNWQTSEDKRRLAFYSTCSADNRTSYVFQANLNYDPSIDTEEAERLALEVDDTSKPYPFREFARIWLRHDYLEAEKAQVKERARTASRSPKPAKEISEPTIDDEFDLDDENTELLDSQEFALPRKGVRVRDEYVMYGQFHLLRLLLHSSPHTTFYLDQDPGLEKACLSAFIKEIKLGAVDACFININKKMGSEAKKRSSATSKKEYKKFKADLLGCGLSEREVELAFIMDKLSDTASSGQNGELWIRHPAPKSTEPEKEVCLLTNTGDRDLLKVSQMILFSSQMGVNRFFYSLRASLNPMGRSIQSASEDYKKWYAYNLYNPLYAEWMLTIFRTFYNYILIGDESPDKMTPAMRLGLTDKPLDFKDVLYFDDI